MSQSEDENSDEAEHDPEEDEITPGLVSIGPFLFLAAHRCLNPQLFFISPARP
jgi:hypothetical protein